MDAFVIIAVVSAVAVIIILFCDDRRSPLLSSLSRAPELKASDGMPVTLRTLLAPSEACDIDRTIVWRMQLPALHFVSDQEPRGTSGARLRPIYIELLRQFPEMYEGHTFEEWLEFLVALGLFSVTGRSIHITQNGHKFLEFLAAQVEVLRESERDYTLDRNSKTETW